MSGGGAGAAWRLEEYASLGSTSDTVRARALVGEADGLAVLALRQTQGRGTQGKTWVAPEGNLNLSVLMRPRAGTAGQWALACGVALQQAVAAFLPDASVLALKWPNDLLLQGRKLAGILVEAEAGEDGVPAWLCVGFGVNLAAAPLLPERPTACLAELVAPPAPRELAEAVLDALAEWRVVLEGQGFGRLRTAWLNATCPPGTALRVARGGLVAEGAFDGLAEDGALLLRTAEGTARFYAGEVMAEAG
jgi:BirA family biotin operon repressor/biotin-[acetyl-CoA-carboxylase] ligase